MRHLFNAGFTHGSTVELGSWHLGASILRALLSRPFRDLLLSAAVILSIAFFTVATLVLMVTTVNSSIDNPDIWSPWTSSPAMGTDEGLPATIDLAMQIDGMQSASYLLDRTSAYQRDTSYAALSASDH